MRRYRLDLTRSFIADWQDLPSADRQALVEHVNSRETEFLGSIFMVAQQLQAQSDS